MPFDFGELDPVEEAREKLLRVHGLLCAEYGCPVPRFHDVAPMDELISSVLNHRTRNRDAAAAFRRLRARFPTWDAILAAPTDDVQAELSGITWPELKAPRVQAILAAVREGRPDFDLDFLGGLPVAEARTWLEKLPGVGPKTSAAVLAFSRLRGRALPVDSHHHRVAARLGLLPEGMAVGASHAYLEARLPPEWGEQEVFDHHEVLMFHGQRVCFPRDPACERCVVLALCPTGRARLGADDPAPRSVERGTCSAGDVNPMAQNDNLSSSANASGNEDAHTDVQSSLQDGVSDDVLSADPGREEHAQTPLSPEEYAREKKAIEEQGDRNESGHANG